MDKIKIHKLILEQLRKDFETLSESAHIAKEASTNEESKAENKYDTRGLEASYLAGAQAIRAAELEERIYKVERVNLEAYEEDAPIRMGNLVILSDIESEAESYFFLLPVGGTLVKHDGRTIKSLTAGTPIGKQIVGKVLGDIVKFKEKELEILEIF